MNEYCGFRFAEHADKYPPVIARAEVSKYFPWLSAKRMANLDGQGAGPKQAYRNGRAVIYPAKSFLEWLDSRNSVISIDRRASGILQNEARTKPTKKRKLGRKSKLQEVQEKRGLE